MRGRLAAPGVALVVLLGCDKCAGVSLPQSLELDITHPRGKSYLETETQF